MKAKTYDEWKELGYQVKRGEKCTGRLPTGKGTFTREQVEEDDFFDRKNNLRYERD